MTEKKANKQALHYDAAEFLETDEDIVASLSVALGNGAPDLLLALWHLGRSAHAAGSPWCKMANVTSSPGTGACLAVRFADRFGRY